MVSLDLERFFKVSLLTIMLGKGGLGFCRVRHSLMKLAPRKSLVLVAIVLVLALLALTYFTGVILDVSQNTLNGNQASGTNQTGDSGQTSNQPSSADRTIFSAGLIATANVGVYSDSACSVGMSSITWGTIIPGNGVTQTIYIKNIGTGSIRLNLVVNDWSPALAGDYIGISWNQEGTQLFAGQTVAAIITLTVSPTITGITTFSNTIKITGASV